MAAMVYQRFFFGVDSVIAGSRVNADLLADAEGAGADTTDAMSASHEMMATGKRPTTGTIYKSRPSASGSLLMSTTRTLGQMTTKETSYLSKEPHLLHYDVEVSDEIVNDPMAYLTSDGHREMRLYYSRTAAQGLDKGVALQDSIWSQFVSSPLDNEDHGDMGVDLRKLAEWVSQLEPTGVNDQKAMCILLKGLLRDLLSDKLKLVTHEVAHTRQLLEEKMMEMARSHAAILHELHDDLARAHAEMDELQGESDGGVDIKNHLDRLHAQISKLAVQKDELQRHHKELEHGQAKMIAKVVKGKSTIRKMSVEAVAGREENAKLTAQLDEELSKERQMAIRIEDLEDDLKRHEAHITRLMRELKTMNYSNDQMQKKVTLAERVAEEAARNASEWEERVERERKRNESRVARFKVDVGDLLGEGGKVEDCHGFAELDVLMEKAVERLHNETGLSIYIAKLDKPTAGQTLGDGKLVLNYVVASKDAKACKNRTLDRGLGVTYDVVDKNMNVHVRDVTKPTPTGSKVHLFDSSLSHDAVSGSYGAIPIQVQYLSNSMAEAIAENEDGAPTAWIYGALCFDNLNVGNDANIETRRRALEEMTLAHKRGDGFGFTHSELDAMEDFAAILAKAVDKVNQNHDALSARTAHQISSWGKRRYEALKHEDAWYIVTDELEKTAALLNILTEQISSPKLSSDLREIRGYASPPGVLMRLVVSVLLFSSPHQHEAVFKRLSQMAKEGGASGYDYFPAEEEGKLELWEIAHPLFVVANSGKDKAKSIAYKMQHAYRLMEAMRHEDIVAYRTASALSKSISAEEVSNSSACAKLMHTWALNMDHAFQLFESRNKIVAAEEEAKK